MELCKQEIANLAFDRKTRFQPKRKQWKEEIINSKEKQSFR